MTFNLPVLSVVSPAPVLFLIGAVSFRAFLWLVSLGIALWNALPFT